MKTYDINAEARALNLPVANLSDSEFRLYCKAGDEIEIGVFEEIGDDGWGGGVDADAIAQTLKENPTSPVRVRINSPGGVAYDGLRIYNMLVNHEGPVTTVNEGLAYSAASVIFMAGDERQAHEASDFGIHRAQGGGFGSQYMMTSLAAFLAGLDDHMIEIYSAATGHTTEQVTDWIDGDTKGLMGTMFSGSEAFAQGFATEIIPNKSRKQAAAAAKIEQTGRNSAVAAMIASRKAVAAAFIDK